MNYKIVKIKGASDYLVDTNGQIFSLHKRKNPLHMTYRINNSGYYRVTIYKDNGEKRQALVHRLVAENFIENKENLSTVNHIDMHKTNNSLSNLEWMNIKDNIQHAVNHRKNQITNNQVIPIEFIEMIKQEYTGERGQRNQLINRYKINHKILVEILGVYKLNWDYDEDLKELVKDMYKGKYGDLKKIIEYTGISRTDIKNILKN